MAEQPRVPRGSPLARDAQRHAGGRGGLRPPARGKPLDTATATPGLERLFAYGTLVSGGPPAVAAAMTACTHALGPATTPGRLFDAGAWPALLPPRNPADRVPGTLFAVHDPRPLWPVLDAWEGCGAGDPRPHLFRRERVEVTPVEGPALRAWAYRFAGDASGWPRIPRWPPPAPDRNIVQAGPAGPR